MDQPALLIVVGVVVAFCAVVYVESRPTPTPTPQPQPTVLPSVGLECERQPLPLPSGLLWTDEEFEQVVRDVVSEAGGLFRRGFFMTLAGPSHRNVDGTSRIAAIRKCGELAMLTVLWEPDNPHDSNAMSVWHDGEQLGFLHADTAAEQVRAIKRHGIGHMAFFRHANRHPRTDRIVGALVYLVQLESAAAPE